MSLFVSGWLDGKLCAQLEIDLDSCEGKLAAAFRATYRWLTILKGSAWQQATNFGDRRGALASALANVPLAKAPHLPGGPCRNARAGAWRR